MDSPANLSAFALLLYLLPGFLGGAVYEAVAEARPRTASERVLNALIVTLCAAVVSNLIASTPLFPSVDVNKDSTLNTILSALVGVHLATSTAVAIAFGLVAAFVQNHGWLYAALRALRLTNRTGRIDVWHEILTKHREVWIQVLLKDGRRLVGWPEHYSEDGARRELFLAEATWFVPEENSDSFGRIEVAGPGVYIIDWSVVEAIEFLNGGNQA